MTGRLVLLGLLLFCVAADAAKSGFLRKPSCVYWEGKIRTWCPKNYRPVCGSNGRTYGNECSLCAAMAESDVELLIVKDGKC